MKKIARFLGFLGFLTMAQVGVAYAGQVTCNPGYYLPAGSETCAVCPGNGYYCPGGSYVPSEYSDGGLEYCNKTCGNDYQWETQVGATSSTDCTVGCTRPCHHPNANCPAGQSCQYNTNVDVEGIRICGSSGKCQINVFDSATWCPILDGCAVYCTPPTCPEGTICEYDPNDPAANTGYFDNDKNCVDTNGNPVQSPGTCEITEIKCKQDGYYWNGSACVAQNYKVVYDCDNGGQTAQDNLTYGTNYTVNDNIISCDAPSGHAFQGWDLDIDNSNALYQDGAVIQNWSYVAPEGTATFTARWGEDKYHIIYTLYGGSWASGAHPETYVVGDLPVSITGTLTRDANSTFQGWCWNASHTNCVATTGSSNLVIPTGTTGNVYLYAWWDCVSPYELDSTYQCVPGSVSAKYICRDPGQHERVDSSITYLSAYTVQGTNYPHCSNPGYDFSYWRMVDDNIGDGTYYPDEVIDSWGYSVQKTFEANWTGKRYRLEYRCGSGTGNTIEDEAIYGQNYIVENDGVHSQINCTPPNGYEFSHWNFSGDGGVGRYTRGDPILWTYDNGNQYFTAQYTEIPTIHCGCGKYLPANATECANCPAGSYCPDEDLQLNTGLDQGIYSCKTNCVNDGVTSVAGEACAVTDCYIDETVDCDTPNPECPQGITCTYDETVTATCRKNLNNDGSCGTSCTSYIPPENQYCPITSCPDGWYLNGTTCTQCPEGFTHSNPGATSESQCYKDCTTPCETTGCLPEGEQHGNQESCAYDTTSNPASGQEYYNSSCNAVANQCDFTYNCDPMYHHNPTTYFCEACNTPGQYWDSTIGSCVSCPGGYTSKPPYNWSIDQCYRNCSNARCISGQSLPWVASFLDNQEFQISFYGNEHNDPEIDTCDETEYPYCPQVMIGGAGGTGAFKPMSAKVDFYAGENGEDHLKDRYIIGTRAGSGSQNLANGYAWSRIVGPGQQSLNNGEGVNYTFIIYPIYTAPEETHVSGAEFTGYNHPRTGDTTQYIGNNRALTAANANNVITGISGNPEALRDLYAQYSNCGAGYYYSDGSCLQCPEGYRESPTGVASIDDCYGLCYYDCVETGCPTEHVESCTYEEYIYPGIHYYSAPEACAPPSGDKQSCPFDFICEPMYHHNSDNTACISCEVGEYWNNEECDQCNQLGSGWTSKDPFNWSIDQCYRVCENGATCNTGLPANSLADGVTTELFDSTVGNKQIEFYGNVQNGIDTCNSDLFPYCARNVTLNTPVAYKPIAHSVIFNKTTSESLRTLWTIGRHNPSSSTLNGDMWSAIVGPGQQTSVSSITGYAYTPIYYPIGSAPEAGEMTGQTFAGYYYPQDNGTQYVGASRVLTAANAQSVTSNLEDQRNLYAGWTGNTYTVEYKCGEGATGTPPANGTATYNTGFTPAANTSCTYTGHTFEGWSVSNTNDVKQPGVEFTWLYTENKTFTAKWSGMNSYSIYYENMTNATPSQTGMPTSYTYGTGATINGVPTRDNSEFIGWCTDASLENCAMTQTISATATEDKTFWASWECLPPYHLNSAGTACEACEDGYYWDGHDCSHHCPEEYPYSRSPYNWSIDQCYNYCDTATCRNGDVSGFPNGCAPERIDSSSKQITFRGNALNGTNACDGTVKYCAYGFASCQNATAGLVKPMTVPVDFYGRIPQENLGTLYIFGKRNGGTSTDISNGYVWSQIVGEGQQTPIINNNGLTYRYTHIFYPADTAPNADMTGYTFNGYYYPENSVNQYVASDYALNSANAQSVVTSQSGGYNVARKLYATLSHGYTPIESNAIYKCGEGSGTPPATESVAYGTDYTVKPNTGCSKTGATFAGWLFSGDGNTYTGTNGSHVLWSYTTDQTFTAQWTNNTYTVEYKCGEGATGNPPANATATYNTGFTPAANTSCTYTGRTFLGWAVSGTNDVKDAGVEFTWLYTENKTFTAKWSGMNSYNINYENMTNATPSQTGMPTSYTYGTGATINGVPTRDNSEFRGWCTDASLENCAMTQTISATATEDKTFWASWECLPPYHLNSAGTACEACEDGYYWDGHDCSHRCPTGWTSRRPYNWSENQCYRYCQNNKPCELRPDVSNNFPSGCSVELFAPNNTTKQVEFYGNYYANPRVDACDGTVQYCPYAFTGCQGASGVIKPMTTEVDFWKNISGSELVGKRYIFGSRAGGDGDSLNIINGRIWSQIVGPGQQVDVTNNNVTYKYTHIFYPSYTAPNADVTGYTFEGYYYPEGANGSQYVADDYAIGFDNAQSVLQSQPGLYTAVRNLYATLDNGYTPIQTKAIYDCGEGTGTPPNAVYVNYGAIHVVQDNTACTSAGATFAGWSFTGGTGMYTAGTPVTWNYITDQTFTAQWTTNEIEIDWQENGGDTIANGSCNYGQALTLASAPNYDGHTFSGWKLANGAVMEMGTTINGGCVETYTGVTSGPSTVITAQWCDNCPTIANGDCELTIPNPGECNQTITCHTGYELVNGACVANNYTVTYDCGAGSGGTTTDTAEFGTNYVVQNDNVNINCTAPQGKQFEGWSFSGNNARLYQRGDSFTWTYANNSEKFTAQYESCANGQISVNGVCVDCECVSGTGVNSCNTGSSNNQCNATATCADGYAYPSASCEGALCSAECTKCEPGYHSNSTHTECVANTIEIDWDEDQGVALPNYECTYNQDLQLTGSTTRTGFTFNGWILANDEVRAANTNIVGGCIETYTGVTSGTSRNIKAKWCEDCVQPAHGSCSLNANTAGTCAYSAECEQGYVVIDGDTPHPYCTANDTYTVTYQANGGNGSNVIQPVEYDARFITKDGNIFNKTNHIITSWETVSGGTYPEVSHEYTYITVGNTVLNAGWEQCNCTPVQNTGVDTCVTEAIARTNECRATATCLPRYIRPETNCVKADCSAQCTACNDGWISRNGECVECSAGTYQSDNQCLTCPDNTISGPGATQCTPCDPGSHANGAHTQCIDNIIGIIYNNGGHGNTPSSTTCTYNDTLTLPAAIVAEGYTFNQWTVNNHWFAANQTITCNETNLGVTSGSVTITADWGTETYTISYVLNGGTAHGDGMPTSYTYESGAYINGQPTRSNSQFAGWCKNANLTNCAMTHQIYHETGNQTFYAKWTCNNGYSSATDGQSCDANIISITYNNGGHGIAPTTPASCIYGGTFTLPAAIETDGYTFRKWSVNNNLFNANQTITCNVTNLGVYSGSVTITADWNSANVYSIDYELNGGTPSATGMPNSYTYESGATINGQPTRNHSEFKGWCKNSNLTDCAMTQQIVHETGNKVFYAKWECEQGYSSAVGGQLCTANTISINYSNGGHGSTPASTTCTYGGTFTLPAAIVAEGYTFNQWTVNNRWFNASQTIACDVTNLGVYSGSVTITADWNDAIVYQISYELNGGTASATGMPTSYTYDSGAIINGVPTRDEQSVFAGWCKNSNLTDCAMTQQIIHEIGPKKFYAKWNCVNGYTAATNGKSCQPNVITVYYSNGGHGSTPMATTCTYDNDFLLAPAISADGYTFNMWSVNNKTFGASAMIKCTQQNLGVYDGSVTIVATWNPNTIALDWNENGGTEVPDGSCTYGGQLRLTSDIPSRNGFTFNGWILANDIVKSAGATVTNGCVETYIGVSGGTSHDITAKWCENCVQPEHGSCTLNTSVPGTCEYGATCDTGYTLGGSNPAHPTCTANKYNITYSANGGSGSTQTQEVFFGKQFVTRSGSMFTKSGYIVTSWETVSGGSYPELDTQYTYNTLGDTSLRATWTMCSCIPGTGVQSCSVHSNNDNTCSATPVCEPRYENPVANCNKAICNSHCTECDPGEISMNGICTQCQAGTYQSGNQCLICPDGYISASGATQCSQCPVGTTSNPMHTQCVQCPAGYISVAGACIPCEAGTYQSGNQCLTCPTNMISGIAASSCELCPDRSVANQTHTQCIPCEAGQVSVNGVCVPCEAGKYQSGNQCLICPTGTISSAGATRCIPCPSGTVANDAHTQCVPCPAGSVEVDGVCVLCVAGTYQSGNRCISCPAGTISGAGATQCTPCPEGTLPNSDQTQCVTCPAGKILVNGTCKPCPAGTYQSGNQCLTCPAGTISGLGAIECELCPAGTQPNEDHTQCLACPAGQISVNGICEPCPAGTYQSGNACEPCPPDHSSNPGAASVNECFISNCPSGQHIEHGACVDNIKECSAPNATYATRTWIAATGAYGACVVEECNGGYHISANACVQDDQTCTVEHGHGEREWNSRTNQWGNCLVTKCDPGYEISGNACVECYNRRVNGEVAVSSYVAECEIAACMYQGQKYALEGNECRPICENKSDDTGTMTWDNNKKQCVRTCNPGYKMW